MMRIVRFFFLFVALAWGMSLQAKAFDASWIAPADASPRGYGIYYFRKDITLPAVPQSFPVHVSGDNRYKFYVNGTLVALGPARSDADNWNYDTVDLAALLRAGTNTLAAVVWNDGDEHRPVANTTLQIGFFLQGTTDESAVASTDGSWRCMQDRGYQPLSQQVLGYYAAGPGECRDFRRATTDWLSCDISAWTAAKTVCPFFPHGASGAYGTYPGWHMQPSPLPQSERSLQRLAKVRQATGVSVPKNFLAGKAPLTVPARTKAEIILDQEVLTNAYLTLTAEKGRDARLTIGYAEGFYDDNDAKGNRNEIAGKHFTGRKDSLIMSGNGLQEFTTLAWRTYRYVVLTVETAGEPLVINDIYGTFTGYPFTLKASLDTKDAELQQIFATGWRTARLCAGETYMDCPYYEQLQYFGDARIQALVSLFNTDDDRLVKNCIRQAEMSRTPEGIAASRYPSSLQQLIHPYSLHVIYAIHDYMMYGADQTFVADRLSLVRSVLDYFHKYQQADGRVANLPGWNFSDWVDNQSNWQWGVALPGADGSNAVLDLQLLYAYQLAADIEKRVGLGDFARLYTERAGQLREAIVAKYWRAAASLFADRADVDVFSQHANALALLTGIVPDGKTAEVARRLESGEGLAPASIYFRFYVHQALAAAGLGDHYLSWLGSWRENLRLGLTTWAELPDPNSSRSDCHAWGSSPNIELLRTVLGVDSDAPAFRRVVIAPHLGDIKEIGGTMPHPSGAITVAYRQGRGRLEATVTLPDGVTGTFKWKGNVRQLTGGVNRFSLSSNVN